MVAAALAMVAIVGGQPARAQQSSGPVAPLPSATTALTRIAFGSCLHQVKPQPIWRGIAAAKPQLMVMMGDNVYGSTTDDTLAPLIAAYAAAAKNAEFTAARAAFPMLAIWDDHDYGRNDAGGDYAFKAAAADAFLSFWGPMPDRPADGGLYHARTFGPAGQRVQIILLDTRSFRSPLRPKSAAFPHWGRYEPDADPAKTMLGASQWQWLVARLQEQADLRIVVSSVQALAEGHGFERWGNLPVERERLLTTLAGRAASGLLLVSGDRHYGAIYVAPAESRDVVEMTASAMNMASSNPAQDARVAPLASELIAVDNFGLADIDWEQRTLSVSIRGVDGETLAERAFQF